MQRLYKIVANLPSWEHLEEWLVRRVTYPLLLAFILIMGCFLMYTGYLLGRYDEHQEEQARRRQSWRVELIPRQMLPVTPSEEGK
jgi:hypothetical protein